MDTNLVNQIGIKYLDAITITHSTMITPIRIINLKSENPVQAYFINETQSFYPYPMTVKKEYSDNIYTHISVTISRIGEIYTIYHRLHEHIIPSEEPLLMTYQEYAYDRRQHALSISSGMLHSNFPAYHITEIEIMRHAIKLKAIPPYDGRNSMLESEIEERCLLG